MQSDSITVLNKIALVNLDIHIWTGRKKLRPEDIDGHVPPNELASLGTKRIINPKRIAVFDTLKRRTERMLGKIGIKLLGGYAVPLDKLDEVVNNLSELREEYNRAKESFIKDYPAAVDAWIKHQGDWGKIIRAAVSDVKPIEQQLSYGWQIFQVQSVESHVETGLDEKVDGLAGTLFEEIANEAFRILDDSFLLKDRVGQRAVKPIIQLQEKLYGLAFLDSRAYALSEFMEETMDSMPKVGTVEGRDFVRLFGLLVVMSKPDRLVEYGQRLLDGETFDLQKLGGLAAVNEQDNTSEQDSPDSQESSTSDSDNQPSIDPVAAQASTPDESSSDLSSGWGW